MEKIKWKEFEKNATQFLNNLYTEYDFITQGNSDSTAPDIVLFAILSSYNLLCFYSAPYMCCCCIVYTNFTTKF